MLRESDSDDLPVTDMKSELSNLLDVKRRKEEELAQSRAKLDSYDQEIMLSEQQKNELMQKTEEYKNEIEKLKLSYTEKNTQKNSLMENSEFVKSDIEKAISEYMEDEIYDKVEKSLIETQNKIESMGAINLAAIDELSDQNERKKYLDEQYEDLSSSVSTLENAIKKIDSETKSKFREMFDNINSNLNSFFTKIFGGGKAYLELTENDLLSTGVRIMARPPGKLVKNINLLSGGEKAGTGIAFVFSIFKSNPAPFCLLDEVDAPLDDANNSRFCSVVREMSESVQFIFITHNKLTMELADILNGVTMREAGISKMVTVNVNDAIKLAETQPNSSVQDRPS
jgi:chromosome segregation protein